MKTGCIMAALLHVASSGFLYMRTIPSGKVVDGGAPMRTRVVNASSPMECAQFWQMNRPFPRAFEFDAFTWKCIGYDEIYGLKNSAENNGRSAHLLVEHKERMCSHKEAIDELNEFAICRPDWKSRTNTAWCYRLITYEEYKDFKLAGKDHLKACELKYPFALAASIHSAEEERFIVDAFHSEAAPVKGSSAEYGMKLGLFPEDPSNATSASTWKWMDGSEMNYQHFHAIESYCARSEAICSHGGLYWRSNDKESKKSAKS